MWYFSCFVACACACMTFKCICCLCVRPFLQGYKMQHIAFYHFVFLLLLLHFQCWPILRCCFFHLCCFFIFPLLIGSFCSILQLICLHFSSVAHATTLNLLHLMLQTQVYVKYFPFLKSYYVNVILYLWHFSALIFVRLLCTAHTLCVQCTPDREKKTPQKIFIVQRSVRSSYIVVSICT